MISRLSELHDQVFGTLERALNGWFLGFSARLVFAAVLYFYYLNSAATKIEGGVFGFLSIKDGAYAQILPKVLERYDYDASKVPFFYDLIVVAGTYAEFILPSLIVLGLFTRLAALGMIGFVAVQSYVDLTGHGLEPKSAGALFDILANGVLYDQRLLWVFVLAVLVVKGAGAVSLDHLLGRLRGRRRQADAGVAAGV